MPVIAAVDGIPIHFEVRGSGPPVVLLAGWGFSDATLVDQAELLAARGLQSVTVDLRGHGRSGSADGDWSIAQHAADVAAVLDQLPLEAVSLIGWSLGGMVALRLAARRPELVARLCLVGSVGVATGRREGLPFGAPAAAMRDALVRSELGASDRPAVRRATIARGFATPPAEAVLDRLVEDSLALSPEDGVDAYRALFDTVQPELLPRAADRPLALIAGEQDAICPPEAVAWFRARCPDAAVTTLPLCGHYPMFETPQLFTQAVLRFVSASAAVPIGA